MFGRVSKAQHLISLLQDWHLLRQKVPKGFEKYFPGGKSSGRKAEGPAKPEGQAKPEAKSDPVKGKKTRRDPRSSCGYEAVLATSFFLVSAYESVWLVLAIVV